MFFHSGDKYDSGARGSVWMQSVDCFKIIWLTIITATSQVVATVKKYVPPGAKEVLELQVLTSKLTP
jgi:hypothetical protein